MMVLSAITVGIASGVAVVACAPAEHALTSTLSSIRVINGFCFMDGFLCNLSSIMIRFSMKSPLANGGVFSLARRIGK
jgi:hypothetical protein